MATEEDWQRAVRDKDYRQEFLDRIDLEDMRPCISQIS